MPLDMSLARMSAGIHLFAFGEEMNLVGTAGFEPTTTTPPVWCATRLRYAPIVLLFKKLLDQHPLKEVANNTAFGGIIKCFFDGCPISVL